MNIRMDGQEVRFRVKRDEFERLLAGDTLEQLTILPEENALTFQLQATEEDNVRFRRNGGGWCWQVPHVQLVDFFASLPRKDGWCHTQSLNDGQALELILEVDVRRK